MNSFNPRARVGRDSVGPLTFKHSLCFNPRARVGRDAHVPNGQPLQYMFQSTRPRGARHSARHERHFGGGGFNPRARVGRDKCGTADLEAFLVFQSTRPRGARPAFVRPTADNSPFQSTRPRGARLGRAAIDAEFWGFNPRARVGRD